MKMIACLAAAAALAGLGCRGSDPRAERGSASPAAAPSAPPSPTAAPAAAAPPPSKEYASDIEKLCDVVRLSGAEAESPDDRRLPIANWLAANLATAESRQFLAQIQPLVGAQKADALDAEARRVGLASCSLAAEWRSPPTR
jgi:hypothetical protein